MRLPRSPDETVGHPVDVVSPGYLEALGARLLQGRFFTQQDESGSLRVVIVNEAAARAGWADGAALGDPVVIGDEPVEVIGIIGDVRRHALEEAPGPTFYLLSG